MIIDSHTNLHHEKLAPDLAGIMQRAKEAGVGGLLNICCNVPEFPNSLKICQMESPIPVWGSIGVHPHHAAENPDLAVEWLVRGAQHEKIIGIGETGLDYHYDFSPRNAQLQNLQIHMEAVRETGLPLIIHTREADADMEKFLDREMGKQTFAFELHSYTSGSRLAQVAAEMEGYFSVNGIATFKNAGDVRDIIRDIMPGDRIMLETDCPHLAPVPYRGRTNEPALLPPVVELLAELKGWTLPETKTRTTDAFFALFAKAAGP